MISWQSIMSVFNTKGTLLKWLKTLDQSLKDGVLETVTVNSVSEGVITLSFNFADGSVITTPGIDIPHGAQGPQGIPGTNGANGKDGESFKPMGEWVTDNEYHPFDYVTYQGSSYLCTETIIDGTDAPPIDTAHWQLVAEKGDQGEPGASPDIPTPTTADNGKVLGVANGAYALQEASGGGNDKYEQITNGGVHDENANTITFTYNGDLSIYGEFFVTGSSSDGDGTTFLAMSAYIPFITGNGMVVPVEYSKFKNYMTSPTEKGTLYGVASVSKSSFELIVYDVPTAPDRVFGPGFYLYGKK